MDKAYADTVRLLLNVMPDVFANDVFAMKGGTAINLFVRNMPRLSVDIDVVFTPWQIPREQALSQIAGELENISTRLKRHGLKVRTIAAKGVSDAKLLVSNDESQVKVETNLIFRGSVLPAVHRNLSPRPAEMFGVELDIPTLDADELYGSKLVAALDRQHPRDLFDVHQLLITDGISDRAIECFVTYLSGHNRPIHEVLFANDKDVEPEYHSSFVGMTTEPVELNVLLEARARVKDELPKRLTDRQRRFLLGLAQATPDWGLLECPHAAELPALQWKLMNLQRFKQNRRDDFARHVTTLETSLDQQR